MAPEIGWPVEVIGIPTAEHAATAHAAAPKPAKPAEDLTFRITELEGDNIELLMRMPRHALPDHVRNAVEIVLRTQLTLWRNFAHLLTHERSHVVHPYGDVSWYGDGRLYKTKRLAGDTQPLLSIGDESLVLPQRAFILSRGPNLFRGVSLSQYTTTLDPSASLAMLDLFVHEFDHLCPVRPNNGMFQRSE